MTEICKSHRESHGPVDTGKSLVEWIYRQQMRADEAHICVELVQLFAALRPIRKLQIRYQLHRCPIRCTTREDKG